MKIEKPSYVKEMGGYNDMPTPFKEIPEHEALSYMVTYGWNFTETRQVKKSDIDGGEYNFLDGIYNIRILWFFDMGIGILEKDYWNKEYRFYRIGCEHKNRIEKKIGNCLREVTCPDCGITFNIDSSG